MALAVCGDGVLDEEGIEECDIADERVAGLCREDCRLECTTNIVYELTDHTCLHVKAGPYQSASASPYPGPAPIGIGTAHVYYTVIAAKNDAGEVVESAVGVTASSTGEVAIYLNEPDPLSLVDSNGETVPVLFDAPVDTCAFGLRRVIVVTLDVTQSYLMVFPARGPAERSVVFENASSKKYDHSLDADGDGFGATGYALKTWCKVEELGFVRNADDCDDSRASVHPTAPELCDAIDNDCDGLPEADDRCEPIPDHGATIDPVATHPSETSAPSPSAALTDAGADGGTSGETKNRGSASSESVPHPDAASSEPRPRSTPPDSETTGPRFDSRETRPLRDGGEAQDDASQDDGAAADSEVSVGDEGFGCTVVGRQADRDSWGWGGLVALVVLSCGLRRRVAD